jgi:ABC-2 type transport system ATP-binding protein
VIEVQSLTKRYGSHTAVEELSFEVPRGQICGFLGPNGAGKSTTLRMLTGFLSPSEGSIRIGGVDALEHPIEARRQIGYMPEACPLYPEMRVQEYLRYRAELKGVPRKQIKARVEASLEQAAVDDVAFRIIGQLSKGYRQRVGLADALLADPPLLVLDEPTAGLDPNQIRQVRGLITKLAKDKTVLLSTHILPEVEATCDRVLIIHRGRLVSEGQPDRLRASTATQRVALEVRGSRQAVAACLREVEGASSVSVKEVSGAPIVRAELEAADPDVVESIFHAIVAAGLVLRELRLHEASLEDVFADLTTNEAGARAAEDGSADSDDDDSDDDDSDDDDSDDDDSEEKGR